MLSVHAPASLLSQAALAQSPDLTGSAASPSFTFHLINTCLVYLISSLHLRSDLTEAAGELWFTPSAGGWSATNRRAPLLLELHWLPVSAHIRPKLLILTH